MTFLTFGDALQELKSGKEVKRNGWNGKNMSVFLFQGSHDPKLGFDDTGSGNRIGGVPEQLFDSFEFDDSMKTVMPCLCMNTAQNSILYGWLASQTDMLAEDWQVVEK